MDNNKPPYVTSTPNLNVKSKQPLSSSSSYPPPSIPTTTPESSSFNNDISEMPNNRSEIFTLLDDINNDGDLDTMDGLSLSDDTIEEDMFSAYLDIDKLNPSFGAHAIDSGTSSINERLEVGHQQSQSINGSTTSIIKPDMTVSASENDSMIASRKAMSDAELVELAMVDPKRAKRIWTNRQSAARSKERKIRYIFELEKRVQTLETEVTSSSTQLTILQRDTQRMTTENDELRMQLQTMRQQLQLQNALKNTSREEIRHLTVLIGQTMANRGPMNSAALVSGQQYYPNTQDTHAFLASQQLQQLQSHSQMQQHQLQQHQVQQQQPQQKEEEEQQHKEE